jgi:hypothetical protein
MPRQNKRRQGSGRAGRKGKPQLHLLHPDHITFENLMEMFRRLTGPEPTPEEVEEARREWDRLDWSS